MQIRPSALQSDDEDDRGGEAERLAGRALGSRRQSV
jgi:hypothetical protein